jgi:hypothetical protein
LKYKIDVANSILRYVPISSVLWPKIRVQERNEICY